MTSTLQPLRAWLAAHPSPDEVVSQTRGGDVRHGADGTRVLTLPYPEYGAAIPAFWEAVRATDWDAADTRDYLAVVDAWLGSRETQALRADHFAAMDRATLFNALRWLDRGERFCDGHWADAFRQGLLHAAARALIALG